MRAIRSLACQFTINGTTEERAAVVVTATFVDSQHVRCEAPPAASHATVTVQVSLVGVFPSTLPRLSLRTFGIVDRACIPSKPIAKDSSRERLCWV